MWDRMKLPPRMTGGVFSGECDPLALRGTAADGEDDGE